ncbi:shikimate dehydrogenase [Allofrancisella guangzhouensis]|uniref:shikimate dehydrogenase (NADP(+)) n=1 Tax=Allofrancisella guangzhouensis TaxID=594679 RepID=A0A0A8E292_9GAMM|nr:shikimate dehydrogenase [Allofrancisella guangzhouensis]AJC48340.1 shikimate dehydrogenase [Allofrancisella guangzhouensis]MBK2026569.1 shikimate dehydrogenase [Allofrancisella guangzhouensis]MBK2044313.1 shikimate dehydrogenase [Allofrancisella guangzhouensis]MBK2045556.1 shikimate dehydrogenase [Allofrancisella guangzhouensis]
MQDLYHVIGYPVKHSLSPKIQMELAKQYNQNMLFTAIEVAPEDLEQKIKEFKANPQVKGLSVTIPHKEKVFELCDDADDVATDVKAASNVVFRPDRKMIALNYDGLGIVNDIKNNHQINFQNKNILVVGAGGAAKAVIAAIIKEKPKSLTITNRTKEKALKVKKLFEYKYGIEIEDFENISKSFDIVINSTSSSIAKELLPLTPKNFNKNALAYDLMYSKTGTVFTQWCQNNNIKAIDGKGMLLELTKAIFKYWRGI